MGNKRDPQYRTVWFSIGRKKDNPDVISACEKAAYPEVHSPIVEVQRELGMHNECSYSLVSLDETPTILNDSLNLTNAEKEDVCRLVSSLRQPLLSYWKGEISGIGLAWHISQIRNNE